MEIKNDIPTLLYTNSGCPQLITLTEREHQSKSIVTFKIGDFIVWDFKMLFFAESGISPPDSQPQI